MIVNPGRLVGDRVGNIGIEGLCGHIKVSPNSSRGGWLIFVRHLYQEK